MYGMKVVGISEKHRTPGTAQEKRANTISANMANVGPAVQKSPPEGPNWFVIGSFALLLMAFAVGTTALIKVSMFEQEVGITKEIIEEARTGLTNVKNKQLWLRKSLLNLGNTTLITNREFKARMSALFQASSIKHITRNTDYTWNVAVKLCNDEYLQLCTLNDIFPPGVWAVDVKVLKRGSHWTPIRDRKDEWVQVGAGPDVVPGETLTEAFGDNPYLRPDISSINKDVIFCCYPLPV